MNDEFSHEVYFSQFVDDRVVSVILRSIGIEDLLSSKDEHLNDIPLHKWDSLTSLMGLNKNLSDKLKETGEGNSKASMVCIFKNGARQIIRDYNNEPRN